MNNERIQQLIRFVQEEPGDPFNIYALAVEYMTEQPTQARPYFDDLLTNHPDYLPTYYHAAALYANQGEHEKAHALYDKGIELARKLGKQKTLLELQRAKQALADENEDW
jgi:tetratricopeptide (TPR) repeat protein